MWERVTVGLGRLFLRRRGGGYGDVYRDFYQPPIGQSASHNYCGQVEDECGRINYWIDWTLSVLPLDDALSSMFRLFVPPRSGSRMRQVTSLGRRPLNRPGSHKNPIMAAA